MTFALVKDLIHHTLLLNLESTLKAPTSLPDANMPMSKPDRFFEVADKIIEALDQQVVPFNDLAAIACGGEIEQSCSHCHKKISVQGILPSTLPIRQPSEIIFNPLETDRYICEATECYEEEYRRNDYNLFTWSSAVLADAIRLRCPQGLLQS